MTAPHDLPVFPRQIAFEHGEHRYGDGITLRQLYAGLAMQSFIASTPDTEDPESKKFILTSSVEFADGLLAELQKPRAE